MPVEPVGVDRKFYTAHLQEGMPCWRNDGRGRLALAANGGAGAWGADGAGAAGGGQVGRVRLEAASVCARFQPERTRMTALGRQPKRNPHGNAGCSQGARE